MQDISLQRKSPFVMSFIGKGGSGKTTLVKATSKFFASQALEKKDNANNGILVFDLDSSNKHLRNFNQKGILTVPLYKKRDIARAWEKYVLGKKDAIMLFDFPASFTDGIYYRILEQSDLIALVLNPLKSVIEANIEWLGFILRNGLSEKCVIIYNKAGTVKTKDQKEGILMMEKIEKELGIGNKIVFFPYTEKIKWFNGNFNQSINQALHDLAQIIEQQKKFDVERYSLAITDMNGDKNNDAFMSEKQQQQKQNQQEQQSQQEQQRHAKIFPYSIVSLALMFFLSTPSYLSKNAEVKEEQRQTIILNEISAKLEETRDNDYDGMQYIRFLYSIIDKRQKQLVDAFINKKAFKYRIQAGDALEHFAQWAFQRYSGFLSLDSYEAITSYYKFYEELKKANNGVDILKAGSILVVPAYNWERSQYYERVLSFLFFLDRYIDRARITGVFGEKRKKSEHLGIDIASREAAMIRAIKSGIVYNAGYSTDYGFFVDILVSENNENYIMRYAHLAKRPKIKRGQRIREGNIIGFMGKTGKAFGTHLHLEFLVFSDNKELVPVDAIQKIFEILENKKAFIMSNIAKND
ncbi:MAG: M23 family metallopeptidase [Candidatus Anstonellales archaeon]